MAQSVRVIENAVQLPAKGRNFVRHPSKQACEWCGVRACDFTCAEKATIIKHCIGDPDLEKTQVNTWLNRACEGGSKKTLKGSVRNRCVIKGWRVVPDRQTMAFRRHSAKVTTNSRCWSKRNPALKKASLGARMQRLRGSERNKSSCAVLWLTVIKKMLFNVPFAAHTDCELGILPRRSIFFA